MEKLKNLLDIKTEVLKMDFSYENVHRIMYLVYESRALLESSTVIPNKEIALDQTKKLIANEVISLICADGESHIKLAFNNLHDNFRLVLSYFT